MPPLAVARRRQCLEWFSRTLGDPRPAIPAATLVFQAILAHCGSEKGCLFEVRENRISLALYSAGGLNETFLLSGDSGIRVWKSA